MSDLDVVLTALTDPVRLWSRGECLSRPSPVPAAPGLYGWYFGELPPAADATGCVDSDGWRLLYVGIAPSRPLGNNGLPSTSTLRSRIRMHYAGTAEGSTLRLTLGSLLTAKLDLSHDPNRKTKTFGEGEGKLSEWMARNARVTWVEHREPWAVEAQVIAKLNLPLNLAHNRTHTFWAHLTKARSRRMPSSGVDRGSTDD